MRKLFIAALATLALTALGAATAADRAVLVTRTGFIPADVTIAAGDTVTWRNSDTVQHQVAVNGVPCNLTLPAGASASCTFRAGGRFRYRDPSQQGGAFRGTVTVTGARSSVTIAARPAAAAFTAPVTLSGFVSSQAAGESVVVEAQECGKTTATRIGTATSAAGGAWSFVVKPAINTVYQARWRTNDSTKLTVRVRPRIRLGRSGGRFTARVTAAQAFTGKQLAFQRFRPAVRRWATLKRVALGRASSPTAGTFVTPARFRARVRKGWRLRVLLPQAQAGTCYLSAPSNTLRVR